MRRILVPHAMTPSARPTGLPAEVARLSGAAMGTTWSVQGVVPPTGAMTELQAAIEVELDVVVQQMSTWLPSSDLQQFNRGAPDTWHALPQGFFEVLRIGLQVAMESDGAFDPTVGALVDLWGFGPRAADSVPIEHAPTDAAIADAHASCGWRRMQLDPATRRACQPGGMHLDLSGIAKGFAVDRVVGVLHRHDVADCLVEIGGELRGAGTKPDGSPWWVGIERPPHVDDASRGADGTETLVALHGLSVATSGDYRRCHVLDGVRYAHSIDPRTGRPATTDLAAVTVLHPDCIAADAYATALHVMGAQRGLQWAHRHHLAALFVAREGGRLRDVMTPAFVAMTQ